MKKYRCIWTNRQSERVKKIKLETPDRFGRNLHEKIFYVLPEYEQNLAGFNDFLIRYLRMFLWLIFGLLALLIIPVPFAVSGFISGPAMLVITGGITMLLGCTIFFLPFSTPETVELFGFKKSIQIARISGIGVALLGAGMAGTPYFL